MVTPFARAVSFLVVDDCTLYRDGLAAHLSANGGDVRSAWIWSLYAMRSKIARRT